MAARPGRDDRASSGTVPTKRTDDPAPSVPGPHGRSAHPTTDRPATPVDAAPARTGGLGDRAAPVDIRTVAHLIPAARAARVTLAHDGRSLSRDNLANAMRDDGHGVSNARVSLLLKILRAEQDVSTIGPESVRPRPIELEPLSEVVA